MVISYWVDTDIVNPGVWITVFLILIVGLNIFNVKVFGTVEFWLSMFKIFVMVSLMLLCVIIMAGGNSDRDPIGFRYWNNPGAFNTYIDQGSRGRFYAWWSTTGMATFAYLGTELIAITAGEAENPRQALPKAIKATFYRVLFFYVLTVFLLGAVVPFNSDKLSFARESSEGAAASPFVVAIQLAGIPVLPHILNAAILVFVISAANTDMYVGARTLHGLAKEKKAPAWFEKTTENGIPRRALGCCAAFCLLAYANTSSDVRIIFGYFVTAVINCGLLVWLSILVSHICFVRARRAQGIHDKNLDYKAPFGVPGSVSACVFCIMMVLFKNYDVFTRGRSDKFDVGRFIASYLSIPVYVGLMIGYKLRRPCKRVDPMMADLMTDRAPVSQHSSGSPRTGKAVLPEMCVVAV